MKPRPAEYALHDCMHPLTPTKLPLRDYFALYARQIKEAGKKNPLRVARRPIHPPRPRAW